MDNIQQFKVNKGEWSEVYVLFKILDERAVSAAGSDLLPIDDDKYTFLKVYREEVPGVKYEYNLETDGLVTILDQYGNEIKVLNTDGLNTKTRSIFRAIKDSKEASFEIPEASGLMHEFLVSRAKAGSLVKSDILAEVSNKVGRGSKELGFSIKSHIGGAPTLVNSSSHTNFIYEVVGFNGDAEEINSIEGSSKIRDRLTALYSQGASLQFKKISSESFTSNLKYTDMLFPALLSEMLLNYYLNKGPKLASLVQSVVSEGKFDITEDQLTYKTMDFLRASALGMVPSKAWNAKLESYGGYIVVLADGSIVCYHLFNDDEFKEYLLAQTKFDTPSTTKYKFGELYYQDGKLMMNLNLQIRFLK